MHHRSAVPLALLLLGVTACSDAPSGPSPPSNPLFTDPLTMQIADQLGVVLVPPSRVRVLPKALNPGDSLILRNALDLILQAAQDPPPAGDLAGR